jgi:hypothetical protein
MFQAVASLSIFFVGSDKRIVHSRHCLSTLRIRFEIVVAETPDWPIVS